MVNAQDDGRSETGPVDGRGVVVGLLADPDLPASISRRLARDLPGDLSARVSADVCWEIDPVSDPFEALSADTDRLIKKAEGRVRDTHWDVAICITDVPVRDRDRVVVAEINTDRCVALLSLPALGGLRLLGRTRDVVVPVVAHLAPQPDAPQPSLRGLDPSHEVVVVQSDDHVQLGVVSGRRLGLPRLLAGMVRANRPWKLVLGLSTVLAGAMTGVAFGVLYSAIWQLGAALSPSRLAAVTLGAIASFALWLIVGHDLWERRTGAQWRVVSTWLRNAAMLLTVGFGALMFFLLLFAIATVAAAVVIPPGYLEQHIGGTVGWGSYVTVGLMASVLGTVAGAVGSGLENDESVRRATYGHREQERWREVRRQERDLEQPDPG